jgi:hypothetical protein
MVETNTKKELFTKILFIIGIIVLIFIFAYALIKIVPKMFSGLASVGQFVTSPFTSKTIKISSSDTSLNSGDKFILSWEYNPKKTGDYNISYDCQENLSIQIVSDKGPKSLLCNTKYNLQAAGSAELVASLKKQNIFVDLPIKIEYIDSENKSVIASGEIKLNVKNETLNASNTVIVSDPISITNNSNTGSGLVNYGPADLAITNAYAINDNVITFTISNIGGTASGIWYFDYINTDGQTESSPMQVSLSRGQALKYTLNLDSNYSNDNVKIIVDPRNNIYESNEINNQATIVINGNNYYDNSDYNSNDNADLKITDFEVGRISSSDKFTQDDQINVDQDATVRFTVKNIGGKSTGNWRYKITGLPYDNDDDKESKSQSSLRPGQSREITVTFTNPDEGNYTIKVKVDSDNDVDEESESNNSESDRLEVVN